MLDELEIICLLPRLSNVETYIPNCLPPVPKIRMEGLFQLVELANRELGRLDIVFSSLSELNSIVNLFEWKEALLSSQIEGIQAKFSDLLLYQNEDFKVSSPLDIQEVVNYKSSLQRGLNEINRIPISSRLLREVHFELMQGPRGLTKTPGEFRRSQNWIGGAHPSTARFVPPPPTEISKLISDLEKFIHSDSEDLSFIVKLGLVHVQFETIHPFLDGNGRVGRLLINLMLHDQNILKNSTISLSSYLKSNRDEYYFHLNNVRSTGDWESWLKFFLNGVIESSSQVVQTTRRILKLLTDDDKKIQELGRVKTSARKVFEFYKSIPIASVASLTKKTQLTAPAVYFAIENLRKLGILHEITGQKRNQIFLYKNYFDILSEGTDPI